MIGLRRGPLLLLLAALLLLPVFAKPRAWTPGPTFRYLLVLDVTQSMNVRDAGSAGTANTSRLEMGRRALLEVLEALPCGSQVSIALFAEAQSLPLFEPLEVCDHFPAMERVLAGLSWRMAWDGNSQVDLGLSNALVEAQRHRLDLIFLTDGDQAPRRAAQRLATLQEQRGQARGWLVGIGQEHPRPVPRLDAQDRVIGYWEPQEAQRQGFNPNLVVQTGGLNFSYGGEGAGDPEEHLSARREPELRDMARAAGLRYHALEDIAGLRTAALDPELAVLDRAPRDLRWVFGLAALLLLIVGWSLPARTARAGSA